MLRRSLLSTTLLVSAACVPRAFAADVASPSNAASVSEVLVTAEHRTINIQDAPLAITAISSEQLATQHATNLADLQNVLPNTQIKAFAGAFVFIQIRGVSQKFFTPGDEAPVGVYLDGGYIARPYELNGQLYDIARIEALPGPQGTLYGRNTSGGALKIVTNHPNHSRGGYGEVDVGSFEALRFTGAANMPVNDDTAVRIAFQNYTHSGYARSGSDDADQTSARVSLKWNRDGAALFASADMTRISGKGPGDNYIPGTGGAIVPDVWDNRGVFTPAVMSRIGLDVKQWGTLAQFDYDLNWATLTVLGVHREALNKTRNQQSDVNYIVYHNQTKMTSLEVRLASADSKKLEWQTGAYLYFEKWPVAPNYAYNAGFAGLLTGNFTTDPSSASARGLAVFWPHTKTEAAAFYGQVTWSPVPPFHVTAGARYSWDHKAWPGAYQSFGLRSNFQVAQVAPTLFGGAPICISGRDRASVIGVTSCPPQDNSWSHADYKVGVSYDLSDDSMIYANVSTGYKAGGMYIGPISTYQPETVTSYEMGTKNRLFDNRLILNLDAYILQYKDFVGSYTDQATFITTASNIGNYEAKGASVLIAFMPTATDVFNASIDYYGSEVTKIAYPTAPLPSTVIAAGAPLAGTTPWRATVAYQHRFELRNGALVARAQTTWRNKTYWINSPVAHINDNAHFVSDLSVQYEAPSKDWVLTAYVQNISNEKVLTNVAAAAPNNRGRFFGTWDPPRTYGASLRLNF